MSSMKKRWIEVMISILCVIIIPVVGFVWHNKEKENRPLKFGATYMTMNDPYFEVLDENIEEVVEANGDILITRDPLQDQQKQNSQIEDMIDEGINVLFLQPVNWKEVQPALNLCQEKGIPVFVLDSEVYNSDSVVSTIISDNYQAGVECAEDMMSKCDSAEIVIIHQKDINSTNESVKGFLDTIEGHLEYQVVAIKDDTAELEGAMEEMKEILYEGISFNVVFCGNDPTALGCIAAMQMMGKEYNVKVYGVDGSPDAKGMIKAGYMEATSAQSPIQIGIKAAQTAYRYLDGKEVSDYVKIPVTLITKDNLNDYDIAGWQ